MNSNIYILDVFDEFDVPERVRKKILGILHGRNNYYNRLYKATGHLKKYVEREIAHKSLSAYLRIVSVENLERDNFFVEGWRRDAGKFILIDPVDDELEFIESIAYGGEKG